ncbi:MAG: hypothetical protein ACRELY_08415 [Polyangiaceae bacterium]
MRLRAAAISSMLVLLAAPAVHAQTAEDQAAARVLFEDGMKLETAGNYNEACPKFEASLKRYSGIGTRGKLAECYEKIGKTASAWALWSEVAAFSHKNMEPDREAYANEHAKNLEPLLSHLVVNVAPANQTAGLIVKRNGEVVDAATFGVAVPVDPGKVTIEASAPDHTSWTQDVDVAEKGSVTIEVPALVLAPVQPKPILDQPPQETKSSWQKPVGMIGVGVGAAVVVTGAVFGLVASSKWSNAFTEGCTHDNNVCTTQQGYDDSHSANTFATLSNVFIISGVVVAGAGAVLWITAPKDHALERAQATLGVSPMPLLGGAGLSFHGSM